MRLKPPQIETEAEVRAGIKTFTKLTRELKQSLAIADAALVKAIDIETSTLRPYGGGKLLTIAISHIDDNFSFVFDHPKAPLPPEDRAYLADFVRRILTNQYPIIAHNSPFELEWFIHEFGPEIVRHGLWEDTMLQAHILDERVGDRGAGPLSLDFLIKMHFGVSYKAMFKSIFKLDKKNMAKADLNEVLTYNAADTKYTLKLWRHQFQLLKEAGLLETYQMCRDRQPTVALMQFQGMEVNPAIVAQFSRKCEDDLDGLKQEIEKLEVVQKYIQERGAFNPLGEDAIVIFRDYLQRPEIQIKESTGKSRYSVDKHVLETIDHPLAALITQLRHVTKLKSTYIDTYQQDNPKTIIWPDGKIHTNFNTCFTETGRTSSSGPNLQNVPQRMDSWVRQQVVPPKDHYIVAFDYGQLEACTAAMCSRDKYLINALWEDYDIHMEFAAKLAKKFPRLCPDFDDPKKAKKFRSLVKNKMVFPAIFGAQSNSIAGYLGLEEGSLDKFMDSFWATFAGLRSWQKKVMKDYYRKGYVTSPLGRRRNYPLKREQAINHPIQCLAADIVCDAMCRLSKHAVSTGEWFIHPRVNIHDDLTMCVPKDPKILEPALETIYRTMLTPPWPDLVNVPISVSGSLGSNWHEMKEIGKFWSHKDV